MSSPNIHNLIAEIGVPIDDPRFFTRAFTIIARERKIALAKDGDNFKRICSEEYDDISKRADRSKIQDSASVRNVLFTRRLANLLINDKGELIVALLPKVITYLTNYLYSLGPHHQHDSKRREHILRVLISLRDNKKVSISLKKIGKPFSNPLADQIIRDTLQLPSNKVITDAHAKRAVLSAWMCYLRQNIGSCFATAPAIIIHDEQFELFLTDIYDLLGTGRLKRTFGGVEYSVPISVSWGSGDLRRPIVLYSGEMREKTEIWLSPGLIAAFETIEIWSEESTLKEKIDHTKKLILGLGKVGQPHQHFFITTAEEIIRKILLKHHSITENDLEAFEIRQHTSMSPLLVHVARTGSGKSEACSAFILQFERAKNAFKALSDNALLKTWEFSLASFSETKAEFTRWNLYSSLGLGPNESQGIGNCIYQLINEKLQHENEKVQSLQSEYDQLYTQIKYLESRIRNASTEKEANWIRVEYQSKQNEFFLVQDLRDKAHAKAGKIANLFDVIVKTYDDLFPRYFQEVYDADMFDAGTGMFDDSPAGFRLLYKHGRSSTALWTRIKNSQEFIESLVSFFIATENEVFASIGMEGFESDLSEIVTAIVNQIKRKEFLESAFYRMAVVHKTPVIKDPLNNLDKIEKKPWAYTSGGTMNNLISCYYRREQKPTEISRWVESPIELLVFLVDTLRQIPYKMMEEFKINPHKSMLMNSPTHAFILKPGFVPFRNAWEVQDYTYTWVRDNMIKPMQKFVQNMVLDEPMMHFLILALAEIVHPDFQHFFKKTFSNMRGNFTSIEFRNFILDKIAGERGLKLGARGVLSADDIDGALYSLLPVFSAGQLRQKVESIYRQIPNISLELREAALEIFDRYPLMPNYNQFVSAQTLQNICLSSLSLASGQTTSSIDYSALISLAAQQLDYAMPAPIIFSDTNWIKDAFGFVVNPGTGLCEMWLLDYSCRSGDPMSSWHKWLNGSRKDISWSIYARPYEYSPAN